MIDFPEHSQRSFRFLDSSESKLAIARINADRRDAGALEDTTKSKPNDPISLQKVLSPFLDPKLYLFSILFFLLNLVSTSVSLLLSENL